MTTQKDRDAILSMFEQGATVSERILDPLNIQIGGGHYKDMAIQPIEFITRNKIEFIPGCVIKRMCRYRSKNGKEDLLKARHEIDVLISLEYGDL